MKYAGEQDIWAFPADARAIPTNGVLDKWGRLVMGAGLALQAKTRYPGLSQTLGNFVRIHGNEPCFVPLCQVFSFPTKGHWRDCSSLELITESALKLSLLANAHDIKTVAIPKVGCGLGGLKWEEVASALENLLDDRFIALGDQP